MTLTKTNTRKKSHSRTNPILSACASVFNGLSPGSRPTPSHSISGSGSAVWVILLKDRQTAQKKKITWSMSLLRNHVNCSCVSSMENKEELELTWCPQVFGATFLFVVLSSNCFDSGVFPLRVSWQAVWIPSQSLSPHSLLVLWQKRQDVCVFGEFERRHKKMCKTASSEPQEYVKVKNYKIFFFFKPIQALERVSLGQGVSKISHNNNFYQGSQPPGSGATSAPWTPYICQS